MKHNRIFSLYFILVFSGCGIQGNDTIFRYNLQRTGVYETKGVPELNEIIWEFKSAGWVRSSRVIAHGMVYFGSEDYNFYALDIKTGQEIWKFETENIIITAPAVVDGLVYCGIQDNYL